MADNAYGLNQQDMSDLQAVYQALPQGDPRRAKVERVLGLNTTMTSPTGEMEQVPRSLAQQYLDVGYEMGQPAANAFERRAESGGAGKALGSDLLAMAKGSAPLLAGPIGAAYMGAKPAIEDAKAYFNTGKTLTQQRIDARRAAGHGNAYILDAGAAEALGANVQGMEQAAETGDVGGVLGHAAAVPTAMALTYGAIKGLPKAAGMASKVGGMIAREAIENTLRPAPKMFRFGKNPVEFVLDNKIAGNSVADLHAGISDALDQKISQLNDTLNNAKQPVDLAPAAQGLADAITRAKVQRNVPLVRQLTQLYNERFSGRPMQVLATEAAEIKRGIQDSINWSADAPALGKVKMQLQGKIGDIIHDAVPGAAALDSEISSGIEAKNAAYQQMLRSMTATGRTAVVRPGMLGAGVGAAVGEPITGAALGVAGENAMRSPAVATRIARGASGMQRTGAMISKSNLPAAPAAIAAPVATAQPNAGKPLDKASAIKYFKAAGGNLGNYQSPQILERAKQLAIQDGFDPNKLSFNPQTDLSPTDLM